jgi:hypothetical protein
VHANAAPFACARAVVRKRHALTAAEVSRPDTPGLKESRADADALNMRPPTRSLREYAAFLVLGTLLVTILTITFAASVVVGGGLGLLAGLIAGAASAQMLRRPAGRAIGRLVA